MSVKDPKAVKRVIIFIRPRDQSGWIMGDDWEIEVPMDLTLRGLMKYIEFHRGISEHRQVIKLKTEKTIPKQRELWSLKKIGIIPKQYVFVEPSFPGAWLWNNIQYYTNKLINEICTIIDNNNGPILLSLLSEKIKCPPPIKISLRIFLKKYPEYFKFTTELLSGKIWIERNPGHLVPSYITEVYGLGAKKALNIPEFPWDDYSDIDGVQRIEIVIDPFTITYHFSIMMAINLFHYDIFDHSYIYFIVLWNKNVLGTSSVKYKSLGSINWKNDRFTIQVLAETEISKCSLSILLYEIAKNGEESYYGMMHMTGIPLKELLCSGKSSSSQQKISSKRLPQPKTRKAVLATKGIATDGTTTTNSAVERVQASANAAVNMSALTALETSNHNTHMDTAFIVHRRSSRHGSGALLRMASFRSHFSDEKGDPNDIHDDYGELVTRGGLAGYEVAIVSARDLARNGDHFVVILWVDIQVGHTEVIPDSNNPIWASDEVFHLKIPLSLSVEECVLELQLWSMNPKDKTRRGAFNGAVRLTGEDLKHLLMGAGPWASRAEFSLTTTSSLPMEVQIEKNIHGNLKIVCGPAGLFEREGSRFELQILAVNGVLKRVFCLIYWNKHLLGKTSVSVTGNGTSSGNGNGNTWDNNQKFEITSDYGVDLTASSLLKIELYEMGIFGPGDFIGCVIIEKLDVVKLLCQSFSIIKSYGLTRDPEKEEKKQLKFTAGSLIIRGGAVGTRCDDERTIVIHACKYLPLLPMKKTKEPPSVYCIIIWNNIEIGRTSMLPPSTNPFWIDTWFHIKVDNNTNFTSSKLEIQIWHGIGTHICLGEVVLEGQMLSTLLQSPSPTDSINALRIKDNLPAKHRFNGTVQGELKISSPGTSFVSQYHADSAHEERATEITRALALDGLDNQNIDEEDGEHDGNNEDDRNVLVGVSGAVDAANGVVGVVEGNSTTQGQIPNNKTAPQEVPTNNMTTDNNAVQDDHSPTIPPPLSAIAADSVTVEEVPPISMTEKGPVTVKTLAVQDSDIISNTFSEKDDPAAIDGIDGINSPLGGNEEESFPVNDNASVENDGNIDIDKEQINEEEKDNEEKGVDVDGYMMGRERPLSELTLDDNR